jgi:tRNA threonylcarbamoyladenosine biosynthesis protein TsaE
MISVNSDNSLGTADIGYKIASCLKQGDVVILQGPLGVGKTVFIKGVLAAFGIDKGEVLSPTFTIIREYKVKFNIYHMDFYRLQRKEELFNLGYQNYLYQPQGITLLEWGERIESNLKNYIKIKLDFLSLRQRIIEIDFKGSSKQRLKCFSRKLNDVQN